MKTVTCETCGEEIAETESIETSHGWIICQACDAKRLEKLETIKQ